MLLAKNVGISLKEHSQRVCDVSLKIFENIINDNKLYEAVKYAALLHDIGKNTEHFQKILKGTKEDSHKFRHNEVSWAIVEKYFQHELKSLISSAVYWHHGISNTPNENCVNDILSNVNFAENIETTLLDLLSDNNLIKECETDFKRTPFYYEDFDQVNYNNISNLIIRACVISADRIVSSIEQEKIDLNNKDIFNKLVQEELSKINKNKIIINKPYDNERYIIQKNIAENCKQTTIINAPAGFGKTIVGIEWAKLSDKKLIWVCPTNSIASSVYKRILSEINATDIKNINVELFLTGEVKESTSESKGFDSDIIITNIDNFLKPTVDNSIMDKLYYLLGCDVIFDEYDQLICESALFAAFITIMQARHKNTKSRTLLLSATYQNVEKYWNTVNNKTLVLPEVYKHYSAQHNNKIKIIKTDNFNLFSDNTINIVNSIKLAQELHKNNEEGILIHSEFENDKKEIIINKIYEQYGSKDITNKINTVGTHVIQTSHDISYKYLIDSVMSPAYTMQRLGRINRWGEYKDGESEYKFIDTEHKSEKKIVDKLYDGELKDLWVELLNTKNNQSLTLDEFYELYNNFYELNSKKIDAYISKKYFESSKYLKKIYPLKYNLKVRDKNIIKAGSNKLRCVNNEVFVIAKKYGSETEFCNPFTATIYGDFTTTFDEGEDDNTFNKIKKAMELLANDERFDYDELLKNKKYKKLNSETFQNIYCRYSTTPYIRFDKVYHEEYGFINKNFLNN